MELLEERIEKWLKVDTGFGFGYGYGYGSGSGSSSGYGSGSGSGFGFGFGYGDGSGSGFGFGFGYGDGSGSGDGSGYGDGSGSGYGDGSGSGYGYGDGSGSGDGLKSINNKKIWRIDSVPTIINHLNKNVAKGYIVSGDLTLKDCYIVKGHNMFAHGETITKAMQDLQEKIFENLDTEKAIEEFRNKFKNNKKYKGTTFYTWHHILTGSCKMGRSSFVENHNLNLNKLYTVKEFIELTENDYGSNVIKKLKQYYE